MLGFSLGDVHLKFGTCVMTCAHHYGVTWNSVPALKVLLALLPPWTFNSNVLLFPHYPSIVGTIQHAAFEGWLLSLSCMYFEFLPFLLKAL